MPLDGGCVFAVGVASLRVELVETSPTSKVGLPSTVRRIARAGRASRGILFPMPHTYILKCGDGSYYVGSARVLEDRLEQHTTGLGGAYTAKRQPIELVWCEEHERIDDAYAREKQLQGWSRAKRIALIEGRMEELPRLSRNRQR